MRRLVPLLLLAACAKSAPMSAPAPLDFTAPVAPAQVVQRAAQRLTIDGFTVTTSDATGGILTATLTRRGEGTWGPFIACRWSDKSLAHSNGTATLTARLTAQSASTGSKVFIATSTYTVIDAGMLSSKSDTDCASTGVAEQHVAEAVTATP